MIADMLLEGGTPQGPSQDCEVSGSGHKHFDLIFPVVLLCKQKQMQHQPVFHRPYLQGWKSPWSYSTARCIQVGCGLTKPTEVVGKCEKLWCKMLAKDWVWTLSSCW